MAKLSRLWVLMGTAFVETLGSFLVVALLPFYAERYGASAFEVGALVAAFSFTQTVTAPLWGRASDRWGRRPVLLAGLGIAAVAYVVFGFATSLWLLLASRLAQGVGGGTVSAVYAYISDAVIPEERAQVIGWVTAATSFAAVIGPPLGSAAAQWSPAAPGVVTAIISAAALVLAWRYLEEPEPSPVAAGAGGAEPEPSPTSRPAKTPLAGRFVRVVLEPRRPAHALIWMYTFGMLAFSALTGVAALFLERRLGVTEASIWIFFAYVAGLSLLARVFLLGPLVRLLGEGRLLRYGALALAGGLLLIPSAVAHGIPTLAAAVFLVPLGTSLLFPCTTALVSRHAGGRTEVGAVLGVQQAFGGTSRILGPLVAGWAFQHLGSGSPFWIAGGFMLIGLLGVAGVDFERGAATSSASAGEAAS